MPAKNDIIIRLRVGDHVVLTETRDGGLVQVKVNDNKYDYYAEIIPWHCFFPMKMDGNCSFLDGTILADVKSRTLTSTM